VTFPGCNDSLRPGLPSVGRPAQRRRRLENQPPERTLNRKVCILWHRHRSVTIREVAGTETGECPGSAASLVCWALPCLFLPEIEVLSVENGTPEPGESQKSFNHNKVQLVIPSRRPIQPRLSPSRSSPAGQISEISHCEAFASSHRTARSLLDVKS
jgi:hypothetical protein